MIRLGLHHVDKLNASWSLIDSHCAGEELFVKVGKRFLFSKVVLTVSRRWDYMLEDLSALTLSE